MSQIIQKYLNFNVNAPAQTSEIKVWDAVVRFFHWSLVTAFSVAYLTEDDFMGVHSWAGYFILALLVMRLVWGFIGSRYARFSDFIYSFETIKQFLKDTFQFKAKRYLGHNPAGGVMVILLMVLLFATTITGLLVYGAEEQAGPLASWFNNSSDLVKNIFEELHEVFANLTVLLVIIHIVGVVTESLIHGENLIASMWTGFKSRGDKES